MYILPFALSRLLKLSKALRRKTPKSSQLQRPTCLSCTFWWVLCVSVNLIWSGKTVLWASSTCTAQTRHPHQGYCSWQHSLCNKRKDASVSSKLLVAKSLDLAVDIAPKQLMWNWVYVWISHATMASKFTPKPKRCHLCSQRSAIL